MVIIIIRAGAPTTFLQRDRVLVRRREHHDQVGKLGEGQATCTYWVAGHTHIDRDISTYMHHEPKFPSAPRRDFTRNRVKGPQISGALRA